MNDGGGNCIGCLEISSSQNMSFYTFNGPGLLGNFDYWECALHEAVAEIQNDLYSLIVVHDINDGGILLGLSFMGIFTQSRLAPSNFVTMLKVDPFSYYSLTAHDPSSKNTVFKKQIRGCLFVDKYQYMPIAMPVRSAQIL